MTGVESDCFEHLVAQVDMWKNADSALAASKKKIRDELDNCLDVYRTLCASCESTTRDRCREHGGECQMNRNLFVALYKALTEFCPSSVFLTTNSKLNQCCVNQLELEWLLMQGYKLTMMAPISCRPEELGIYWKRSLNASDFVQVLKPKKGDKAEYATIPRDAHGAGIISFTPVLGDKGGRKFSGLMYMESRRLPDHVKDCEGTGPFRVMTPKFINRDLYLVMDSMKDAMLDAFKIKNNC